jgi:hypothetical protein
MVLRASSYQKDHRKHESENVTDEQNAKQNGSAEQDRAKEFMAKSLCG